MVEIVVPGASAAQSRVALFDFDGTLSLVRSGWIGVMVPMMVELLQATGTSETPQQLESLVQEFVARLTGKQTIYQMIELSAQIIKRGGEARDPLIYKRMYLDRLHERIADRLTALRNRTCSPDEHLVPGSRALLEKLRDRGLTLYLASGTDEVHVKEEADLLGITEYFDGGIYGALDDYQSFSKKMLVQQLIHSAAFRGPEFLGFGDGYVEIDEVKQVGGTAVGVATDEPDCRQVDEWKRRRLIGVGADFIVPHFGDLDELWSALFEARKERADALTVSNI